MRSKRAPAHAIQPVGVIGRGRLHRHDPPWALATACGKVQADDGEPLDFARRPQLRLRRGVGMLVEPRIAHPPRVLAVGLPLDRVVCERGLAVGQG